MKGILQRRRRLSVFALSVMALAGCGSSPGVGSGAGASAGAGVPGGGVPAPGTGTNPGGGSGGTGGGPTPTVVSSRYDLANGCFVMKAAGKYVTQDASGFLATGTDASAAERFYMKPAGLGRYLFYTRTRTLLTGSGTAVTAATAPADGSDVTLDGANPGYSALSLKMPVAVDGAGRLVLGGTAAPLAFERATGCVAYPEMPTGIDAATFRSQGADKPVIGFAEVHSHMGMSSEMSDGSGNVGPSAAGLLYGQPINRFGAPVALGNCEALHGPDGHTSGENILLDGNPTESHDTQGWPTFVDWPKNDSYLHQQMYYRWVERAWKAGLRTMVIHGTGIEALCNFTRATYGDKTAECRDQEHGALQVRYLTDIQNYVDAQEGGPGKGWFRLVNSPTEARAAIAEGKLAVIRGLEFPNLFHCRVQFQPGGTETSDCTRESVDKEIDEAWNSGVRQIFPYHDVDSSLGGTGIFSAILNEVGFTDVHAFWKTYDCENGGTGPTYFYNAGAELNTVPVPIPNNPVTSGVIPAYPAGRQCNARTVTPLGKYVIDKLMKKGFVIDIDHAEIKSKQYMLDEGAKTAPSYPMISGHGGQGGLNNAQVVQIVRQGGIVYPAVVNGKDMVAFIQKLKPLWAASGTARPLAIGYGADTNGFRTLPGPRGMGSTPIRYPFTLFQGPGWGPQFAQAGIGPLKVEMLSVPGGKVWNMDEQGMSHYGLVPDIVEEMRIEGGQEATDVLYRSAETYLQLWERTLKASESARTLPAPAGS